jgi:prophage regulatory protein
MSTPVEIHTGNPPKQVTREVTTAREKTKQAPRLLSRPEVVALTGFSYSWIWQMMRANKFPRSRIVGGKSMWLSSEIDEWLANLPTRKLKGDNTPPEEAA